MNWWTLIGACLLKFNSVWKLDKW